MEIIIEVVLQFFAEMILQILFELGVSGIYESFRVRHNQYWAILGYVIFGTLSGLLSLLISKQLMITEPSHQKLNIILSAVVAGFILMAVGKLRASGRLSRAETNLLFCCGFVFALSLSLTRYLLLSP